MRIRDLNGLTDRGIAHSEPSAGTFGRKTRPESLESMRPDMVIFNDLTYWRRLLAGSAWFSNELLSLSCGPLLAQNTYVFVRRDSVLAASGRLSVCPDERSTPAEAFKEAVCRRQDWPYSFTRDCATPFDSKNED